MYSGEKKRESYLDFGEEEEDASIRPLKSGCALVDTCIIAFYCRPGRQYGLEESVLFVDLSRVRTWVLTGGGEISANYAEGANISDQTADPTARSRPLVKGTAQ